MRVNRYDRRMKAWPALRCVVIFAVLAVWTGAQTHAAVSAQAQPGASSAQGEQGAARVEPLDHGWVAVRDHRQQVTHLFHLPPRGTGSGRVPLGSIRAVSAVPQSVEALGRSSWGYIVALRDEAVRSEGAGGEASAGPVRQRRVLGQSVISGPGTMFEYPPGRPEVLPSLPGMPELTGLAMTRGGSVALMRRRQRAELSGEEAGGAWTLMHLSGGGGVGGGGSEWRALAAPWAGLPAEEWPDREALCWLLPWGTETDAFAGVRVLVMRAGEDGDLGWIDEWTTPIAVGESAGAEGVGLDWRRASWRLRLHGVDGGERKGKAWSPESWHRVRESGRDFVVSVSWPDGSPAICVLHRWESSGGVEIARLEGVPRDAAVTAVGREWGSSGLALVWFEESTTEGRRRPQAPGTLPLSTPKRRMLEVTLSGRAVFDGGALAGRTGLERELEVLAWILVMTMVGVVVFVLRSDRVVAAPRGYMPADPVRRMLAAFLDYVPAAAAAGLILGVPVRDAVFPFPWSAGTFSPTTLALALGLAWFHTTLGEWLAGRSLGKAALGLWVVGAAEEEAEKKKEGEGSAEGEHRTEEEKGEGKGPSSAESAAMRAGPPLHPPLWSAALRNAIRWGAPVVGLFMLFDRSRRHPGDIAGRTLVIQVRPVETPE